jgi:hypothetical protein
MFHWLAHLTNRYNGRICTFQEGTGIYIGFQCDVCKKIEGVVKIDDILAEDPQIPIIEEKE